MSQATLDLPAARIAAACDSARRRLERDLHDGAQQRLVSLSLRLGMLATRVTPGSEVEALLEASRRSSPRRSRSCAISRTACIPPC